MKYKYYDKGDRLIAESDSPIQFNVARFPIWKNVKPIVTEEKKEEATDKVVKDVSVKQPYKRKKKTEEDYS